MTNDKKTLLRNNKQQISTFFLEKKLNKIVIIRLVTNLFAHLIVAAQEENNTDSADSVRNQ